MGGEGAGGVDISEDVTQVKTIANGMLAEAGPAGGAAALDDLAVEVVRCGAGELHAVASIMGGMGSQEVIKLVTHQLVPCAKTLIYNAIDSTTASVC